MYNNHQQGIYSIHGDMCYDNKLMENTVLSERPPVESVCLTVSEQEQNSTTSNSRRRPRLSKKLIANVLLIFVVLASLYLLEFGPIPNIKLGFYCQDPNLSYPYHGDTVSTGLILCGSVFGTGVIIVIVEFCREQEISKKYLKKVWKLSGNYLIGFMINLTLVEMAKVIVGEHRPHFFSTCSPDAALTCQAGEYVESFTCTNTFYDDYIVTDSSRSFPSGHTSISVYTSFFCAVYIHYRVVSRKLPGMIRPLLILAIFLWSLMCSFTRLSDHRHHWWDVTVGFVLGVAVAFYTVIAYCKCFQLPITTTTIHRPTSSTTTLLDIKNKDATSVII